MKKFLSAMMALMMVGALVTSAFAVLSPAQIIQPVNPLPIPTPAVPAAETVPAPEEVPAEGGTGLKSENGQSGRLSLTDENGKETGSMPATVQTIASLPATELARQIVQEAMKDVQGEVPGSTSTTQIVAAVDLQITNQPKDQSYFPGQGKTLTFRMTFAALNQFAKNPRAFSWNSLTRKWDEAKSFKRIGNSIDFDVELEHGCPLIVTCDGYESYYSRFVGKKVTSPDTLEVVNTISVSSVVSLLGSAGVSKKHS